MFAFVNLAAASKILQFNQILKLFAPVECGFEASSFKYRNFHGCSVVGTSSSWYRVLAVVILEDLGPIR
jgi:hypothetical protein